ncbi:hypothetical protein EON79_23740 [bacterium]|nr:MAG: hypothetical protein EON79_23740 [bacterium]
MKRLLTLAFLPILLAGCSGGEGDVGKKDDAELRNNFTRKLTPEEIKKLQSAPPPGAGAPKAPK